MHLKLILINYLNFEIFLCLLTLRSPVPDCDYFIDFHVGYGPRRHV